MSDKEIVVFGPWVGEFSYEIQWYVPLIRQLSETTYKDCKIIAVGYLGRESLYRDFVDEYITYPKELEDILTYPATVGIHVNNRDIIPKPCIDFMESKTNTEKSKYILPTNLGIDWNHVFNHNPPGKRIHLNSISKVDQEVREFLSSFNNNRKTIAVMARVRYRQQDRIDGETWNPENWKKLIGKLVDELKVNLVLIGFNTEQPGSMLFDNNQYIKSFIMKDEHSVDYQIALLKYTTCSLYGASGAAALAFFTNTPIFTQQSKRNGHRLCFDWQKALTEGHKNVKIFDKYEFGSELNNAPVEELYEEFKEFYTTLIKK